jgi:hypothetical protein
MEEDRSAWPTVKTDANDPTATLAVQCGSGFHAVSSPYQFVRPNRYDAVT